MTGLQGDVLSKDNIDENYEKLNKKTKKYKYKIDKQMLRQNHKLIKIDKENEFKVREVAVKCNMNTLALKAGYTLGKICIMLTFISCLLTFGGNISKFICNIPLLATENAKDFSFTWKVIQSIKELEDGTMLRNTVIYRINIVTTLIYIPFLIGMQGILYQVSITIYIIKTKFKQYYKYALLLQYSMLTYSVYSNYLFLSYYVQPTTILDKAICFIPSFLLDIACIFFLSLSVRMKTLNYDNESETTSEDTKDLQQKLLTKGIKKYNEYKDKKENKKVENIDEIPGEKEVEIPDKKVENKNEKLVKEFQPENEKNTNLENLERVCKENKKPVENKDENKVENKDKKTGENADIDFNKIYEKLLAKDPTNKFKISDEISGEKKVENKVEKEVENESKITVKNAKKNESKLTVKKPTGTATNKNKLADLNKVKKYIAKLKDSNIDILKVTAMKEKCKIDHNKWAVIKPQLIKEKIIYMSENNRITHINMKND